MADKNVEELMEFIVDKKEDEAKASLKDILKKRLKERLLSGLDAK